MKKTIAQSCRLEKWNHEMWESQELFLIDEWKLKIYVDGNFYHQMMCTPENIYELIVGYLYSDGVIHGLDDIKEIQIQESQMRANVLLGEESNGLSAAETSQLFLNNLVDEDTGWTESMIEMLYEALQKDMPVYQATESVHGCLLMNQGTILCKMEDIGRHNAVDKVIGWALRERYPLGRCILFSSGRIPTDMMSKVLRSGIRILATKSLPTVSSIELAKEHSLTLLHYSKKRGLLRFT